jgi:hypothetical protein
MTCSDWGLPVLVDHEMPCRTAYCHCAGMIACTFQGGKYRCSLLVFSTASRLLNPSQTVQPYLPVRSALTQVSKWFVIRAVPHGSETPRLSVREVHDRVYLPDMLTPQAWSMEAGQPPRSHIASPRAERIRYSAGHGSSEEKVEEYAGISSWSRRRVATWNASTAGS